MIGRAAEEQQRNGLENFTPISSLIGGALIGAAAALLLGLNGRIAGISGIAGGLFSRDWAEVSWRGAFLVGLIGGVALYRIFGGSLQSIEISPSVMVLAVAGLLVGVGTGIGGGCTSGHGVCGMARLSPRSLAATLVFLAVAMATVLFVKLLGTTW